MLEWLKKIFNDLNMVTEQMVNSAEPDEEVGPEEYVIGTLGLDLRKFFFVFRRYCDLLVERATPLSADSPKKLKEEILCFKMQTDVLKDVFWSSCRYHFPELRDKMSIGLRRGWKIVWVKRELDGIVVGIVSPDDSGEGGPKNPTIH